MKSKPIVLIISPDPEAKRLLELAFELDGFAAKTSSGPEGFHGPSQNCSAIIIDVVENSKEQWKMAGDLLLRIKKHAKTVLLAPRGLGDKAIPINKHCPDILVRKPYELLSVVESVKKTLL